MAPGVLVLCALALAKGAQLVPPGNAPTAGMRPNMPLVACTGGGILFWWQAGAIHGLREQCALDEANFIGASAGSLAAVLAASGVDMDDAFEHAITLSKRANLWERPLGVRHTSRAGERAPRRARAGAHHAPHAVPVVIPCPSFRPPFSVGHPNLARRRPCGRVGRDRARVAR